MDGLESTVGDSCDANSSAERGGRAASNDSRPAVGGGGSLHLAGLRDCPAGVSLAR